MKTTANACPHCGNEIEPPDKFYTLVTVKGQKQKVVNNIQLSPNGRNMSGKNWKKEVPVVCVVERDEG